MSPRLGRTRVHSSIQSILIVTKARDNRLIKLTRELALYLMLKPQKNGRGMIVCVRPLSSLCYSCEVSPRCAGESC